MLSLDLIFGSWLFGVGIILFFFFKQKTAYEMRISDWSSDVCSSDLRGLRWLAEVDGVSAPAVLAVDEDCLIIPWIETGKQVPDAAAERSDERRVGKECVSTCRSRWSPDH